MFLEIEIFLCKRNGHRFRLSQDGCPCWAVCSMGVIARQYAQWVSLLGSMLNGSLLGSMLKAISLPMQ